MRIFRYHPIPTGELGYDNVNGDVQTVNVISEKERTLEPIMCDSSSGISNFFDSTLLDITKLEGLRVANLNVNSLIKHIDEIRITLANSPFDILAINESKIDDLIPDSYKLSYTSKQAR